LEAALWAAVVALEERADLTRRLAERVRGGDEPHRGTRFAREARDARERAAVVRDAILHLQLPLDGDEEMDTDG
jgi:two-component system chemotaxis response regulator CheB